VIERKPRTAGFEIAAADDVRIAGPGGRGGGRARVEFIAIAEQQPGSRRQGMEREKEQAHA